MAHLGFLHTYATGALLRSQHWDDELNQIIFALGSPVSDFGLPAFILLESDGSFLLKESDSGQLKLESSGVGDELDVALTTFAIVFSGNYAITELPILKLTRLNVGNFLEIGNGVGLINFIDEQGQLISMIEDLPAFILSSAVKCPNLNADFLNGLNAVDFETDLYAAQGYFIYYSIPQVNVGKDAWICPASSQAIITKLRGRAETAGGVGSVVTFTFFKNGISIGTLSISGITTALQTTDITDVAMEEGDVLSIIPTVVSGGNASKVTIGFNYKQRFINGS